MWLSESFIHFHFENSYFLNETLKYILVEFIEFVVFEKLDEALSFDGIILDLILWCILFPLWILRVESTYSGSLCRDKTVKIEGLIILVWSQA